MKVSPRNCRNVCVSKGITFERGLTPLADAFAALPQCRAERLGLSGLSEKFLAAVPPLERASVLRKTSGEAAKPGRAPSEKAQPFSHSTAA